MLSPVTLLLVTIAVSLVVNLATSTVTPPSSWVWWPWVVWATVGLLVAVAAWVQSAQLHGANARSDDQLIADLATRLEWDWSDEAARRDITRPAPLQVSWSSTGRPAASRQAVMGDPLGGGWQHFPLHGQTDLPLKGQTEQINQQIVTAFRGLPQRQLMVLGEPGAGKSVFCLLLTLGLLRTRRESEQLPLLLPIGVWDPAEPVDAFVARRLAEDYDSLLAAHGDPRQVADRLVKSQLVLPVLDGLDELSDQSIGRAVEVLDDYAAAGRSLVVTCRIREYEQVIAQSNTILTTAAVVELEPVTTAAAIAFLSYPEHARHRWEPIFSHLRLDADTSSDPLARVLSVPLMVALARTAYEAPGTNPAELLRLSTQRLIAGRLMDAFIAAVYTDRPAERRTGRPRRAHAHHHEQARRWLTCLAYQLHRSRTRDLHWWHMTPGLLALHPQRAVAGTIGVASGMAGLLAGLVSAVAGVNVGWGVVAGIVLTAVAACGWPRLKWPLGDPLDGRVRFRAQRRWIDRFGPSAGYVSLGAVSTGLITDQWIATLPAALLYGLLGTYWPSRRPSFPARPITPTTTLSHNRGIVLATFARHALISGGAFAFCALLFQTSAAASGITASVIFGATAAMLAGGWIWLRFRLAHVSLALRGQLPWRLGSSLADAHQRGILRRAGAIYQFRHVILQEHLARTLHVRHLQARAHAGDSFATRQLVDLLIVDNDVDQLRMHAKAGDLWAMQPLVELLTKQGCGDEALQFLRARTDADDADAADQLVELLVSRGQADEAIRISRVRANAQDSRAAKRRLVELLAAQGHTEELRARANAGDWHAAEHLADLLAAQGHMQELQLQADAGNRHAAERLAELFARHGQADEATTILRAWDGSRKAAEQLVARLIEQGRPNEALHFRWAWARTGDLEDSDELDRLLFQQDRIVELRARASTGNGYANHLLVAHLARQGNVNELRARAISGDCFAASMVTALLAEQGNLDEAIKIWQVMTEAGDWYAEMRLIDLLTERGRFEEALRILVTRADVGDWYADRLAQLLARQNRIADLRTRADGGDRYAANRLTDVLARHGQVSEAIQRLRTRADAGDWAATLQWVELLVQQGRAAEAIRLLRSVPDAGEGAAAVHLVELLTEQGNVGELRSLADAGDRFAASRLAELLATQGRVDEGIQILRAWADDGDRYATDRLADLLVRKGRVDEAIQVLQGWADIGDGSATTRISNLLARHGPAA
jgi:predicted negative regulator of RcsB-dependent stress response